MEKGDVETEVIGIGIGKVLEILLGVSVVDKTKGKVENKAKFSGIPKLICNSICYQRDGD